MAVFGCLLAGAVCVPIHPRWPADRVATVVEDCGARLISRDGGRRHPAHWRRRKIACPMGRRPRFSGRSAALARKARGGCGGHPVHLRLHRAAPKGWCCRIAPWRRSFAGRPPSSESGRPIGSSAPRPLGFDLSTFDLFNMALCGRHLRFGAGEYRLDAALPGPLCLRKASDCLVLRALHPVPHAAERWHGRRGLSGVACGPLRGRGDFRQRSGSADGCRTGRHLRQPLRADRDQRGHLLSRSPDNSTGRHRRRSVALVLLPRCWWTNRPGNCWRAANRS